MPADRRGVRAHQRAAHRRRRGDGAAAARPRRARSRASARTTLRVRCREVVKDEPDRRAGRPAARLGAAARPAARAARAARTSRRPAATFPARRTIATHLEALVAMGARVARRRRATCSRRPDGLKPASIYLTKRRSPAPRRRCSRPRRRRASPRSATPRASRTSSSCASSCAKLGVGIDRRRARRRFASKAAARLRGADASRCGATTSRRAAGRSSAAITGGEIDVARRAGRGHRSRRGGAAADERRVRDGRRRVPRRAVEADGRRPHHDRPVARVSERPRQPRHGAGDAGRRARRWCTTGCTSCGCSRSSR